jgi:hypothetical protein
MDEFDRTKRAKLQPIFFEAGAGLYDCQGFENSLAYMLYLLSKLGVEGLDLADTTAILDQDAKRTAGQLATVLRRHIELDDGMEQLLSGALEARNELIHRYFIQNLERLSDPANHSSMVKEIREIRSKVRHGMSALDPFVKRLAKATDGIDIEKLNDDLRNEIATRWHSDG